MMAIDVNGLKLSKGDVVAPISGDLKGRVCDIRVEDGLGFVCVRASHRPYSKGVWYASEHVQRLAKAKPRRREAVSSGRQRR
jgi:hypothetical protein